MIDLRQITVTPSFLSFMSVGYWQKFWEGFEFSKNSPFTSSYACIPPLSRVTRHMLLMSIGQRQHLCRLSSMIGIGLAV